MSAISLQRFNIGIDLRPGPAVSDANKMRDLKNAYITPGGYIKKRPGLARVTTMPSEVRAIRGYDSALYLFATAPVNTTQLTGGILYRVMQPVLPIVDFAEAFKENHYVISRIATAPGTSTTELVRHSIVTRPGFAGTPVLSTISSAPAPVYIGTDTLRHSSASAAIIAAQKVFALNTGRTTLAYSATSDATDWTATNDAGFLPTNISASGSPLITAVGQFGRTIAVFSRDSVQLWGVDPDPALMKLGSIINNTGTTFSRGTVNVAGNLFFLSPYGIRNIQQEYYGVVAKDADIGAPVDPLVRQQLDVLTVAPIAIYNQHLGQALFALGSRIFVYSHSVTSKISAWSYYDMPGAVQDMTVLDGTVYLLIDLVLYRFDEDVYTDDGQLFEASGLISYQSFKRPGVLKKINGFDSVQEGTADFEFLYDARDTTRKTYPLTMTGDSRPGDLMPVEVVSTEIGVQFTSKDDSAFSLYALNFYYDTLGVR